MQKTEAFLSTLISPRESLDASRASMNKNYRVGQVRFIDKPTIYDGKAISPAVMINVIEWCGTRWSSYRLWVSYDIAKYAGAMVGAVGQWVEFGFYIKGSFREPVTKVTTTELRLRHFEIINGGVDVDITIGDPDNVKEEDMLVVPTTAIEVAKAVYEGTPYTPKRDDEPLSEEDNHFNQ